MSDDDAKRLYIQNELARNGLANRSALIGAVAGATAEVAGPWVGKLAGNALTRLALSGGKDAVLLGGQSAASTVATGTAEQQAGIRGPVTPEETFQSGLEGAEGGVLFGVLGAARHGSGESGKTRLPKGGVSSEGTGSERDYGKTEAKTPSPAEAASTGPAPPSSPVGSAEELALKGQQAPAPTPPPEPTPPPTPRVGEQQEAPVIQSSGAQPVGAQPSVETAQEAVGAPPAGIEPSPVSPPPPTPPTPPTPEPTRPVAESEATLREQQAALLDPQNPREAMIYPLGVKPIGITQNKGRFGTARLADGRWVQYDTRGPRHLSKTLIAEYEKNNDLNGLLQLGDVPQTEAVKQSVAGAEPAVVTERAPPSTPGEPGVERKAAAGTTATAPSQVEALEATKTPGSTVQVETPEETIGDGSRGFSRRTSPNSKQRANPHQKKLRLLKRLPELNQPRWRRLNIYRFGIEATARTSSVMPLTVGKRTSPRRWLICWLRTSPMFPLRKLMLENATRTEPPLRQHQSDGYFEAKPRKRSKLPRAKPKPTLLPPRGCRRKPPPRRKQSPNPNQRQNSNRRSVVKKKIMS